MTNAEIVLGALRRPGYRSPGASEAFTSMERNTDTLKKMETPVGE
jgi:hypothetical protein